MIYDSWWHRKEFFHCYKLVDIICFRENESKNLFRIIIRINITLKSSYSINTIFKIFFHGISNCCQTYTIWFCRLLIGQYFPWDSSRLIMIWHLHRMVLDVLFFRMTDFKLFNSSFVSSILYFLGLAIGNHSRFFLLYKKTAIIDRNINMSVH